MEKFFWFSLPITLLIIYLLIRALIKKPVNRRDTNVIFSIYLLIYVVITTALGLFWVARMDLPAFDLHYLFGYCLIFLVCVHLWFQLPLVNYWLKKNSPAIFVTRDTNQWRSMVKIFFLFLMGIFFFSIATIIVYEFITPSTITVIEKKQDTPVTNQRSLQYKGKIIPAIDYIHEQGNITRNSAFVPRVNIEKASLFKVFPHALTIPLPRPTQYAGITLDQVLSEQSVHPVSALDLQRLSDLLFYSYGVTETRNYPGGQLRLRAAASSGALYPNDMYIAAYAVNGLARGLYYYHPAQHSLVKVGDESVLSLLTQITPETARVKEVAAIVFITAYFDRSVWKYRDRSYRYILLDSGHVLGNLTLASTAMHIPYLSTSWFDDKKIEKFLGLSEQNEGVIDLVILGKTTLTPLSNVRGYKSVVFLEADNNLEITRVLHKLTSIEWKPGTNNQPIITHDHQNDDQSSSHEVIELPKRATTDADLFALIKHRRSFRSFSTDNVSFNDFAGVIHDAYLPLSQSNHLAPGSGIDLFVMVSHVENVPSGVYRYLVEKAALEKIADGDFSSDIYHAGLSQEVLKRAAFVIAWVVDLRSIGSQLGEREYRDVGIESGIGSEIAYLAAEARGLGVCAVGAFYDNEVQSILHLNGTTKRAMLLNAVGRG